MRRASDFSRPACVNSSKKNLASGTDLLRHVRSVQHRVRSSARTTADAGNFVFPLSGGVRSAGKDRSCRKSQERKFWENPRMLRIWSAGCSTGEEPYSIAITFCESLKFAEAWEMEILATDISRRALAPRRARRLFASAALQNLDPRQVDTYFSAYKHGFQVTPAHSTNDFVRADESGRAGLCRQTRLHFLHECPDVFLGGAAPARFLHRFYDALEPGGYFLLGHSETLSNVAGEIRVGGAAAIAAFTANRLRRNARIVAVSWRRRL